MTRIGPTIAVNGEITSDEDLIIDGRVSGSVLARDAVVVVGESGHVEADVRSPRIQVLGTVNGSLGASERIELAASARVSGSLSANRVVIADGARFDGSVDMDRRTIAAKVAQYKEGSAAAPSPDAPVAAGASGVGTAAPVAAGAPLAGTGAAAGTPSAAAPATAKPAPPAAGGAKSQPTRH
ncbi:MAG: polymer-forming cytoskeletal protein [Vicinamibacterales bacterium]